MDRAEMRELIDQSIGRHIDKLDVISDPKVVDATANTIVKLYGLNEGSNERDNDRFLKESISNAEHEAKMAEIELKRRQLELDEAKFEREKKNQVWDRGIRIGQIIVPTAAVGLLVLLDYHMELSEGVVHSTEIGRKITNEITRLLKAK